MSLIRRTELASDTQYKLRNIRGFLHLYSGQEAVVVGVQSASGTFDDHFITAYRCHGHQLVRGDTVKSVMAELFGKYPGCSKGKGGSMHLYLTKNNFYGGNAIVGAEVPVGTGLAYELKYNNKKNCAFIFYGDGAANQGQVFESFNMAALWKLPAVYICEDNQYGMGTPVERSSASPDYYMRGAPYMPGIRVDGMNVFAVREAARYAKEWAIQQGPIILHAQTYRYYGHSMSDPGVTYRTRDEIKKVRTERDPIMTMQKILYEKNIASEEEMKQIDNDVKKEVDEAVEFASNAEEPPEDELYKDVLADKEYKVKGICAEVVYHVKQ